MKSTTEVMEAVTRHLNRCWVSLVDATVTGAPLPQVFPFSVPLGDPKAELRDNISLLREQARAVHAWVAGVPGLTVTSKNRTVGTARLVPIPSHVEVADLRTALMVATSWSPARYAAATALAHRMHDTFPQVELPTVLPRMEKLPSADQVAVLAAAVWFTSNGDWQDYTPRQIPVAGLSGKWLNRSDHRTLIQALTGANTSGLQSNRPTRVHLTYVDPDWVVAGGRKHDSWTVGDPTPIPYRMAALLVCENKDSALWFPSVAGLVVMEGGGDAGAHNLCALPWIEHAPQVLYWGDMDWRGYRILHTIRARGVPATAILMGLGAYLEYERFGTNTDEHGRSLPIPDPVPELARLTNEEQAVYARVTDPNWGGFRRVEQERIPLMIAAQHIAQLLTQKHSL